MELNRLISECINKNPNAERELYYLYARRIFGICRRYTSDRQQAEDYMQEGFEKIFSKLDTYDSNKASFSTWVYSVVVYHILNHKRKRKVELDFAELHDGIAIQQNDESIYELRKEICHGISADELLAAMRKLPEDYRNIINLYVFENWKHQDIAKILNIAESSCRSKLSRAKKQLKNLLTNKIVNHEGKLA